MRRVTIFTVTGEFGTILIGAFNNDRDLMLALDRVKKRYEGKSWSPTYTHTNVNTIIEP